MCECDHGPMPTDAKTHDPESPALENLRDIVLDRKLLQYMHYFKDFMHIYTLESFHYELLA